MPQRSMPRSSFPLLLLLRNFIFLLFCLFLPGLLTAQIDDARFIFRELRSLDGTWFMPTDRGDRLEIWSIADDSTLTGRGLRIRIENGDTVTLETMRIEWRDTSITYYATVRGQNANKPVAFRLTEADYEGYLFENPAHDDPQKIRYRLLGNRELQVTTEGRRNGRVNKTEFVFEREFTPGAVEFRLRAGANFSSLRGTGYLLNSPQNDNLPKFDWRPGYEIGAQARFKGRGGFIILNVDLALAGRYSHALSDTFVIFPPDTSALLARRDVTYSTTWLTLAFMPEITFKRDGRLSLFAGPYIGFLIGNRAKGDQLPGNANKLFEANEDFKKFDFGVTAGLQYKLKPGKKRDLGGIIGLRGSLGLANLDNLYTRDRPNPALYNGRVSFNSVALYYSVDLLKL